MDEKEKIEETDKIEDTEKADKLESEAKKDKEAESSGSTTLTESDIMRIIDTKIAEWMDKILVNAEAEESEESEEKTERNHNW